MENLPMGPTSMLNAFQKFFVAGQSKLMTPALSLLAILSLITLTWSALQWTFDEGCDALKELLKKVIFIGLFVWLVKEFPWLTQQMLEGFIWAGTEAGDSKNELLMSDPSAIMTEGMRVTVNLAKKLNGKFFVVLKVSALIALIEFFLIMFCFVFIAINVFLVQVEFGIITTLGLILVPFGVFRQTSFIAEKVFGAIISFGVKLMVLSFILSITYPILQKMTLSNNLSLFAFVNVFSGTAVLAFLSWHAPAMAAGLISGSPSLSAQNVTSATSKVYNSVKQIVSAAATGGPKGATVAATKVAVQQVGSVAGGGTTGGTTGGTKAASRASNSGAKKA